MTAIEQRGHMLESGLVVWLKKTNQSICPHPELRADCGLPPGSAHLKRFISVSAADAFKKVIDKVEPVEREREKKKPGGAFKRKEATNITLKCLSVYDKMIKLC